MILGVKFNSCILPVSWLYPGCILLYPGCILAVPWQHPDCILAVSWLYAGCILSVY